MNTSTDTMLEVKDLSKQFGGLVAVDHMCFSVDPQQIVGIIGPNGAGKTTVFNLISGIIPPTSGKILLDGNCITSQSCHQVAMLGMRRTFQEIHLFRGLTVLQNVKSAAYRQMDYSLVDALLWSRRLRSEERAITELAMELLDRFDLAGTAHERADSLPYGMQKRLEIVKAIVSSPKVLLLDEPAAGLNPGETIELMELIHKIREEMDMTILIIEHSMEVIEGICDNVIVMNFGKKLAEGSWEEVQTNEEVIRCYLGVD
ncbi:MAG: ABC transporter ATP-binding protein [Firmicutes bacterium]|mgnify:CR=1 FL=1|jgi:branched-chain amino acid transport system ATP-binding protein|nr:ABC transporter ATP-binding protein [Bacillota bacterium]